MEGSEVSIIDQRHLPFRLVIETIPTAQAMATAIQEMRVRGAPLIGVAGAFGVYLAARETASRHETVTAASRADVEARCTLVQNARPTAVNLRWAVDEQRRLIKDGARWHAIVDQLRENAQRLADEDVAMCQAMGRGGGEIIREIHARHPNRPVNILTHCNAGWLATIDVGTATAAMYAAHAAGIPLHIWVDETRPRLQGAKLTAFELAEEGIPHTIIADNAGGLLMQRGQVDVCIVGTDRTTRTGDVANKIGTYLKALAAHQHRIPFYAAVPSSSIDWQLRDGREIPIEERSAQEVLFSEGVLRDGSPSEIRLGAPNSPAYNPGFDVTPREFVTGLITERGVCAASEAGLLALFPERR